MPTTNHASNAGLSGPVSCDGGTVATAADRVDVTARVHRQAIDDVLALFAVDAESGLSPEEAARRLERFGRNELDAAPRVAAWRRFLAQFKDLLILILVAAAVVAFVVSGELKTPIVVLVVVLLNAIIGFVQENRAERSLEALRTMLVTRSRVRRAGTVDYVDSAALVPGDIVLVEAGDLVPADGRLLTVANLEIEEAALTGESQPVGKTIDPVDADEVGIGDRLCMAYMNTQVTRGRGEFVVTATGMQTEVGRIAGLLRSTDSERTPLQRQLDGLAHNLAALAGVIVAAVVVIGLIRGHSFSDLMLTAVALAVAAVPEGLPAVTVVTLALGVGAMARRNAIVKRLASVETLGCTSVICSDKTGTLTMNEMTAVEVIARLTPYTVTGMGYSPQGSITHASPASTNGLREALHLPLEAMALCNDATLIAGQSGWHLVGDPTEGALLTLAMKGGVDVERLRADHPRLAEAPFDSAVKFMATVHEMLTESGDHVVRLIVKGAPDVLLRRSSTVLDERGARVPVSAHEATLVAHNERLASAGLRVLAVAIREFHPDTWNDFVASGGTAADVVDDLTLLALAGIVDPPRSEAAEAITVAHRAGISVRMITGDHAATAAAIGGQLGLRGESVTGADLDAMDDDLLARRIDEITVFARVAPEHKMRLVAALQRSGRVVAMTGDGVNDAPALKKADMGIAMGITGTEVSKEAATMVLTDDNFASIVEAVRRGRTIYANIVKFVRFQLSTTLGFAVLFLLASIFDVAGGTPFAAIAILWVNIIMDGPPAMALGIDPADVDVMSRPPRPIDEPILTRQRWAAVALSATTMAVGTLWVLDGVASEVATTVAFATFVLFQFFNILNSRHDTRSVFHRDTLTNRWLWLALGLVLGLQIAVTYLRPAQDLFDTASIDVGHWLLAAVVASSVLWVEEARKLVIRRRTRRSDHADDGGDDEAHHGAPDHAFEPAHSHTHEGTS